MAKKPSGRSIGRDAGSGKFMPVSDARRKPGTSVVEKLPPPRKK